MKKKFPLKRWIVKASINFFVFVTVFGILIFTKVPQHIDSYVYYENFRLKSWLILITYRIGLYLSYPFLISFLELINKSRKKVKYRYRLLENFNIQFMTYSIISAIYAVFGLDKVLDAEIFSSSDSFMFISSFVFTLILNKSLPNLFYDENNLYSGKPTYPIPSYVDVNSVVHDYDPITNSRLFVEYSYNNLSNGDTLVVVLKNPSQSFSGSPEINAIDNCLDLTTNNVMKAINNYNLKATKKYKTVVILNLFPEYSTDPKNINKIYGFIERKSIQPNTRCYNAGHRIYPSLISNHDVCCAWGQNSNIYKGSYDIAISDMLNHCTNNALLEYDNGNLVPKVNSYPLHAQVWK